MGDAIQPSHPLLSPSPPAFNLSQHQGLFQWVSSLHQVAKVLEFQLQHQSFQRNPRADLLQNIQDWTSLGWTGWISSLSKGLSRVFSNTTVQKHQFFGAQLSFRVQLSHPYMTTEKTIALTRQTFVSKVMSLLFNSAILLNYYYSIQTFIYYISIYRIFCLSVFSKMLFFLFSH